MLQLQKLTLTNVGVYKGTREISFDEGLNIIQATNGKGKSTIIQMVEMLIANQYEGNFSDYINDLSNEMFASLDFLYNTTPLTITLSCKRGKSGTERILYDADKNKIATGEDAIEYMSKLYDPVLTQYSLIAKQKPIDNIVTCKDAERRDLFKKIKDINLEKYIKLHVDPVIEQYKAECVLIEKEIYKIEHAEYDYKEKTDVPYKEVEVIQKRKQLKDLQDKQAVVEQVKNEYEKNVKNLKSIYAKIEELEQQIAKKNLQLEEADSLLSKLSTSEYKESKVQHLTLEYNITKQELEGEIDSLQIKLVEEEKSFITKKREIDSTITTIDTDLSLIKIVKLGKYDETILKEIENKISALKQDIKYCDSNIKSLEKGVCPTCGETCTHKLQEYIDKKDAYEKDLVLHESLLAEENSKKEEYEKLVKENEEFKLKKQKLVADKDLHEQKIESLQTTYKERNLRIKESITDKQTSLSKLSTQLDKDTKALEQSIEDSIVKEQKRKSEIKEDVDSFIKSLETEKALHSELQKKVDEYTPTDDDFDSISTLEKDIKTYESIITENEVIEKNNKELDLKKEQDGKNLLLKNKELIDVKSQLTNYEQARTILLKDFPNYVIDASIEEIETAMNDFINMVYYKSLNVSLRSTKTSIKLDYGLGENKMSAHRLSGAESKIVSLAFISYFNKSIPLGCLILDEPDAALASSVAEQLYESLLQMNQLYKQTVVVTHNEKMKNYLVSNGNANIIEL